MKHAFKVISFITIFFYTRLKIFDNASLDHNQIKKKKKTGDRNNFLLRTFKYIKLKLF